LAAIRRGIPRPAPEKPRRWQDGPTPALTGAAALVGATLLYGHLRLAAVEARTRPQEISIGLVQANITNYDRLRAEKGAFETVRMVLDTHYALSDELLAREKADVIVWPETVYPTTFGSAKSEAGEAFDNEIIDFAKSRGVPLVFGAYDTDGQSEYNAAFFLSAREGARADFPAYRKRMLFPLTEWVPPILDSETLREWLPWTGRWQRGPGPKVIPLDLPGGERASIMPLICYDVLFSDFVADAAALGADLIITLSNDSWFPDERAPRMHLVAAAFRSIETRLPQVRATNSGVSAVISPAGSILRETRWAKREALSASVPMIDRMVTPAVAFRRWLTPALLGAALLLVGRALVRGRQGESAPDALAPRQRRKRKAT
jgi:apolipoprotein N-acyltransferase